MGSEVVVIGEVLVSAISALILWAKAKGLTEEQTNKAIQEAKRAIQETRPEDLPDV